MKHNRVAVIIPTLHGGGAEKACITLVSAMKESGASPLLVVIKRKGDYTLPDDLPVHYLFDSQIKLYKNANVAEAAKRLKALHDDVGGFDLVLSNLDDSHRIAEKAGLPNTYYVIQNSVDNILKRTARLGPIKYFRKRKSFNALNNKDIITISEGLHKEVSSGKRFNAKSIRTIYNAMDVHDIREKSFLSDPDIPSEPYIIHVGRFAKQKRHDILFKAMEYIPEHLKLVMLCNPSRKVDRAISRAGLKGRVIVVPFKQNPYPLMRAAEGMILTSDFEGFGMVLAESLICERPTASTDCPEGPSEILRGKLSRYLAPVRNPKAVAERMIDAMAHPEDFKNAEIVHLLDAKESARQYLELLQSSSQSVK